MTTTATEIQFKLHSARKPREGKPAEVVSQPGRLTRVTQVMALAIHFQGMLESGEATDYADLARLAGLSRERMSQIMELIWLAPEIQQEILELPAIRTGRFPISEVAVRKVAEPLEWEEQLEAWDDLKRSARVG